MADEWEDLDWVDVEDVSGNVSKSLDTSKATSGEGSGFTTRKPSGMITPPEMQALKDAKRKNMLELAAEQADRGITSSLMTSAGREMDKLGAGSANLADQFLFMHTFDPKYSKRIREREQDQQAKDEAYEYLREERPISSFFGSVLPYMANIPGSARTASLQAGEAVGQNIPRVTPRLIDRVRALKPTADVLAKETTVGAGTGAAHYDDTAASGTVFGLGGGALGKWLSNTLGGVSDKVTGDLGRILDFAKRNKLYVPSGMGTNNRRLQQIDRAMETHPATTQIVSDAIEKSKVNMNRMLSRELGDYEVTHLTDDYMSEQMNRINNNMDDILRNTSIDLNDSDVYKVIRAVDSFKQLSLDGKVPKLLSNYENKLLEYLENGKPIPGPMYNRLSDSINKALTRYEKSGDRDMVNALTKISSSIDGAADRSLGPGAVEFKEVKRQQNLANAIDRAKDKTNTRGFAGVQGYVDPIKLQQNMKGESNKLVNDLAAYEKIRRSQPPSSLSTSHMVGNLFLDLIPHPTDSLAGSMFLLSSLSKSGAGGLSKLPINFYLSGWPHVTGIVPGAKNYKGPIAEFTSRLGTSQSDEEGAREKRNQFFEEYINRK